VEVEDVLVDLLEEELVLVLTLVLELLLFVVVVVAWTAQRPERTAKERDETRILA